MNRILHLLVIAAALLPAMPHNANAQIGLAAGPRLGLNLADAEVNPSFERVSPGSKQSFAVGPVAGAALDVTMSTLVHVVFEAQYARKGTSVSNPEYLDPNYPDLGSIQGITFAYDYIEFPVLGKLKFGIDRLRWHLVAGVNVGLNVAATGTFKHTNGERTHDFSDDISGVDMALEAGGGLEYVISEGLSAVGDIRYSYGVLDVDTAVGAFGEESWRSRDVRIVLGLMFDFWRSSWP